MTACDCKHNIYSDMSADWEGLDIYYADDLYLEWDAPNTEVQGKGGPDGKVTDEKFRQFVYARCTKCGKGAFQINFEDVDVDEVTFKIEGFPELTFTVKREYPQAPAEEIDTNEDCIPQ